MPQEALVILVGEAMDDCRLNLAADPAIRANRHRTPDVGPEKLGFRPDVTGTFHASEWLDPHVGSNNDRSVRCIEHGVGVDACGLMHAKQVGGPHKGQGCKLPIAHSTFPCVLKIALDVGSIAGHQIPGAKDPFTAHVDPRVLRGDPVKPGVNPVGIERHRIFRADQGEGWLPIAKPDPGIRRIGSFKPGRWNPSRIGHGDWPPGKPVAIVDNDVTIALSLDLRKVRADHAAASLRPWTYSKSAGDLGTQGRAPQPEFVHRTRQRERLEPRDGYIFDQAKTHFPLL